jgi:ketosteroid isomerase-like protein
MSGSGDLAANHASISALVCRYADLIDAGDFKGIADLFAHAVVRSGPRAFQGRDQLLALWSELVRTYDDGGTLTKHLISNVVVEVDEGGRRAKARSSVTVLQACPPDFPLQVIATSRHFDQFEKADGGWRFTERVDVTDLVGDLSRHTRQPYRSGEEA